MAKQEKQKLNHQPYIYIRSTNEQIPVTKQEFTDYYRPINTLSLIHISEPTRQYS